MSGVSRLHTVFNPDDMTPPEPPLIVKVQVSLNDPKAPLYIYSEAHEVDLMVPVLAPVAHAIVSRMGCATKKYFYARITRTSPEDLSLVLDEDAPVQSW